MTHAVGGRLLQRAVLALLALLAAVLALQVTTATAAPQTQTYIGADDGPTPDIYRSDIADYFKPDGSPAAMVGQAGTLNLALDGEPVVAYCVDVDAGLSTTPVTSDVTEVPLTTVDARAKLYILLNATPSGAPTADKQHRAAVAQVAMWVLEGELRETDPTSDAALNADVAALIATARAWAATPGTLSLTVAPPAAGATTATVTVTGRPGSVVALTITAGQGTLSAGQLTVGAGGSATATLTSPAPGTVTVGASTTGDGQLFRISPSNASQATNYARPTVLTATAPVTFAPAQVTPGPGPGPGVTPSVPVTGRPAGPIALRISKTAPTTRRVLQLVRYRITIRNTTRRAATGVVLRDRIPRGLTFVRASRKVQIRGGAVVVRLGRLAPGARRTVTIWMRASAGVKGARTNVATVRGTNVRPRSARAGTTFRPLAGRVIPAVTG
ncbi:DUF11 domain-containing protein [Miltoncostaea marina]|uniref:DUF11 domain-containing protein n=1 Tax=Miltoncostaea marina TaxID=2843215 RepID=UPI001C3CA9C6|nr:DUF11 domain-containing protein [Miltoncostaea marina]